MKNRTGILIAVLSGLVAGCAFAIVGMFFTIDDYRSECDFLKEQVNYLSGEVARMDLENDADASTAPSLPSKAPFYRQGQRVYVYAGRYKGHHAELGIWHPAARAYLHSRVLDSNGISGGLCILYEAEIVSAELRP